MYLKISGGNNKGSAGQLFSYLTKENEIEGKSDDFFNANLLTGENYADFRNSVHTLEEYKRSETNYFLRIIRCLTLLMILINIQQNLLKRSHLNSI